MWLIVVVSLVILIIIYYFFIKNKQYAVRDDGFSYKPKEFLLSKTEKMVYDVFCSKINQNNMRLKIFPKMRLTDFLWSQKDNRNSYLRISGKFIDFLAIERPNLNPVFAIFIVNSENKAKMFSLEIIEPALQSANIKLVKIESDIVFKREELEKMVRKTLEDYYESKQKAH